jgi:hypothetical protein
MSETLGEPVGCRVWAFTHLPPPWRRLFPPLPQSPLRPSLPCLCSIPASTHGVVQFENVVLRYRPNLDPGVCVGARGCPPRVPLLPPPPPAPTRPLLLPVDMRRGWCWGHGAFSAVACVHYTAVVLRCAVVRRVPRRSVHGVCPLCCTLCCGQSSPSAALRGLSFAMKPGEVRAHALRACPYCLHVVLPTEHRAPLCAQRLNAPLTPVQPHSTHSVFRASCRRSMAPWPVQPASPSPPPPAPPSTQCCSSAPAPPHPAPPPPQPHAPARAWESWVAPAPGSQPWLPPCSALWSARRAGWCWTAWMCVHLHPPELRARAWGCGLPWLPCFAAKRVRGADCAFGFDAALRCACV